MMRRSELLLVLLMFQGLALAADKTSPEFLRKKHAGLIALSSNEAVGELFPKLLKATAECWTGETYPHELGVGGAAGALTSASRIVQGELMPDGSSAYILVRAKGGMGLLQSNFLQIDLANEPAGTRVDVYYKNNVKAQRAFAMEVEHWLDGDLNYCVPQPFMHKKKSE